MTVITPNVENATRMAEALNLVAQPLTRRELTVFTRSFNRQLSLMFAERTIRDLYGEHADEILLGAMVAKAQMMAEIDGEIPAPGRVGGPLTIRAGYLGIGNSWENIGSLRGTAGGYPDDVVSSRGGIIGTGTPVNWIHSGTHMMTTGIIDNDAARAARGKPVRIGKNAVHLIFGLGTHHPSPKIESVQFTIDGKERPIYTTDFSTKTSGLKIKSFDTSLLLKENTSVLGRVFVSDAYGTRATDYPFLLGASFIRESETRILNTEALVGDIPNIILRTG